MTNQERKLNIGCKIRKRRKDLGLTQVDLGRALGISYQQVQKYEVGRDRISCDRLAEIAEILRTSSNFLLDNTISPTPSSDDISTLNIAANYRKISSPEVRKALNAFVLILANQK